MRGSPIPTIAVVALLVLAGCTGAPPTGENETREPPDVSPDKFPEASEINPSVFETHATVMGNTSFTLAGQRNRTDRNPDFMDANFSYRNSTATILFDTNDSQFLKRTPGGALYSDGERRYRYSDEADQAKNQSPTSFRSVFNTSGEHYLWKGLLTANDPPATDGIAINATYEREGAEWFNGTAVMRYEATGADALPERIDDGLYANFSATLLLDEDGVIRHYHYTFEKPSRDAPQTKIWDERSYTITDIGTTDVEKPDWLTEFLESE